VTSCDIALQLPQLERNVMSAGLESRVKIEPFYWGESIQHLTARGGFDLILASDIVFIAIRDGITDKLAASLRELTQHCHRLLFVFEERLPDEEQEFMELLGLPRSSKPRSRRAATAPPPVAISEPATLQVLEITGDALVLTQEDALKGAGGHPDTELWMPSLFWEPPPIRLFILSRTEAPVDSSL
jgi:hypothetical protein